MPRLTETEKQEIFELYFNGVTPKEIGEKYNIANNSVTRLLRKHGIPRNQCVQVNDENVIRSIITKYQSGISSEVIAKELNIHAATVCRILKKNNISIRSGTENKRKIAINESFFKAIDTEAKAYFLGFLYADGTIGSRDNNISLKLQEQDLDILKKFSLLIYNTVKTNSYIQNANQEKYVTFDIYSKGMHSDLVALGCTANKSFTIKFNKDLIPPDLLRHFIRGYFDGDGCICLTDEKSPRIDVTSSTLFITGLIEHLESELGINCGKIYHRHKDKSETGNFQLKGFRAVKIFLDYLYKDSTIYLNRKFGYYNKFLDLYSKKNYNIESQQSL